MAGKIPQGFIDELLNRVDIIDVVSSRVHLKKAGKNYSACCPFHQEKTPSFTVSPDKQFYYCFGCGATGSAIKFIMEMDNLSFPEAIEKIAEDLNLEVPREKGHFNQQQEPQHTPLYERLDESSQFFQQQLRAHKDKAKAINYLQGRGLSGKAAKFFGIGYAPIGWDNLQQQIGTDKERIKQLISSGMLIEKDNGDTYDRFRDRIMFPIRDVKGRTIAFGGRVLGDEKPKYLNSPETPVFHKTQELYGLYEARKIRQKLTRFIIVEGYMDVVALAEFGIHYAVATLGTATSEHHLRRLFKMAPEVIFCFDGDDAGRKAAVRAMEIALPTLKDGVQARFLFLPDGEDPDTLVRQEGKDAFEDRLNKAPHLPEFMFEQIKAQVDFDTLDGKARFGQLAAEMIARLPKSLLKEMIATRWAKETELSEDTLKELMEEYEAKQKQSQAFRNSSTKPAPSSSVSSTSATAQSKPAEQSAIQAPPAKRSTPESRADQPSAAEADLNDIDQANAAINQLTYEEEHFGFDASNLNNIHLDSDQLDSNTEIAQAQASYAHPNLIQRALQFIVDFPHCAGDIEIPQSFEAQGEEELLLVEMIKKLKASPQNSTIGLMMQWIGSPYQSEIKSIANDEHIVQQMGKLNLNPAAEISACLKDIERARVDSLKSIVKGNNASSVKQMSAEDKEALRQRLSAMAKRKGK